MERVCVARGIPPALVDRAVELLSAAFGRDYSLDLRPSLPGQMQRLVAAGLDPAMAWAALEESGRLVGVVGVETAEDPFLRVPLAVLKGEFGVVGGLTRWLSSLKTHLATRPRRRHWRIDSLVVDEGYRGRGIGWALLSAVADAARESGARALVLEVVDSNEQVLPFYERMGFRCAFHLPTGPFTARGGYRGVRFMRLDLTQR